MKEQAYRAALADQGLNLMAVFDVAALPDTVRERLAQTADIDRFRQVILFAHGGQRLWGAMQKEGAAGDNPVDEYTVRVVTEWLSRTQPGMAAEILYPLTDSPVPLVELGALAGWHHSSPFRVGIGSAFGSWFAYRALALADSDLPVTKPMEGPKPCDSCIARPCISACPAGAAQIERFEADACYDHRLTSCSSCASTCQARAACPVAREHAYMPDQMAYHYGRSLSSLKEYRKKGLI